VQQVPELGRLVPSFEVLLDDLSQLDDAALFGRRLGLFGTIAFAVLRDARGARLSGTLAGLRELLQTLRDQDRDAFLAIICYLVVVTEDFEVLVGATPELRDDVMTIAEQFRQKGIEQGIEKGIERGMPLGQRAVLVRLLERKFGTLPDNAKARLDAADEAELGQIADRILFADSLDAVFGG